MVGLAPLKAPLFVPATRPDRFAKASASGADAIVIDLEDAVAPASKDHARAMLGPNLDGLACPVLLRVNACGTPWFEKDLDAANGLKIAGILLPKTESTGDLREVARRLGERFPVVALIETAIGVDSLPMIVEAANVVQLAFGSIDFSADIGCAHNAAALAYVRSRIVLYARTGGLVAPLDGVTATLDDQALLAEDCRHAREMGFGGKLAIHPAQIAAIQAAFRPGKEELAWATRVLAAYEAGQGAVTLIDGEMIDAPVVARARQLITAAR